MGEPDEPLGARTRLEPVTGYEPWRSLQPVVGAELSWGNRLGLGWMRGLHDDTWVAHLSGPMHVDRLRERFDLGDGVSRRHEVRGWTLVDAPGRVFLVSQDHGVVVRPGGREVDTGLVARTLGWLDRQLNGTDRQNWRGRVADPGR